MAYEVKILPTAEIEVEGIVEYLSGFGVQPARRFVEEYRHQARAAFKRRYRLRAMQVAGDREAGAPRLPRQLLHHAVLL